MAINAVEDRLLTVQEAADYLRFAVQTVYNKVNRGEIPCVKIGRTLRFRRADLDSLLQPAAKAAA